MTTTMQAQRSPRAHCSSNDEVESLEDVFLKGNFRDALKMANNFLRNAANDHQYEKTSDRSNEGSSFRLPTTLGWLKPPKQSCTIHVYWNQESDDTDRAAAVALQSWYELSKLDSKSNTTSAAAAAPSSSSLRHLQPFLDTYTTSPTTTDDRTNHKAMPLELLVMWIQFCRAVAVADPSTTSSLLEAAISPVLRVLRRLRSSSNISSSARITLPSAQEACAELVLLLFTDLLPLSFADTEDVEHLLEWIKSSPPTPLEEDDDDNLAALVPIIQRAVEKSSTDLPRKHVIQQCLCFCNTDDGNWPEWLVQQGSFRDCRIQLQAMLTELYHHHQTQQRTIKDAQRRRRLDSPETKYDDPVVSVVDRDKRNQSDEPLSITNNASSSTRLVLSQGNQRLSYHKWKLAGLKLLQWLRKQLTTATTSIGLVSSSEQKQKLQLMLLIVVLMYGWRRHRHKITAVGKDAATTVFWKPIVEILEALNLT